MNPMPSHLTPKTWMALIVALIWCAAVLGWRHLRPVSEPRERAEVAQLRAELSSLPDDVTARLQAWREAQSRTPSDGDRRVLDSLGHEGWRVIDTAQGLSLAAADAAATRWASIAKAVEQLEAAGFVINSLNIETAGSRTVRQFGGIVIDLRHDVRSSPANPVRTRGVGPGSGPGAAGLRETGPGSLSADRATPPAATPGAGSVFRSGDAPVPATLAPAAGSANRNPNP